MLSIYQLMKYLRNTHHINVKSSQTHHCRIVGIRNRHPLAQQLGTGRRIAAGTAEASRIRILIVNSEDLDVIIVNSGTAAVIIDDKAIWIDMALITFTHQAKAKKCRMLSISARLAKLRESILKS